MLKYIRNEKDASWNKTLDVKGETVHTNKALQSKNIGFAEVHLNQSEKPVFVQTRIPHWIK